MFDELFDSMVLETVDVLLEISGKMETSKQLTDSQLVDKLNKVHEEITFENGVYVGINTFYKTGALGKYRKLLENAYSLFYSKYGISDEGDICRIDEIYS